MLMPDVNILLYAHRANEKTHAHYRTWLEALANKSEPFALSSLVAASFVRIATHAKVFSPPTTTPIALATIDALVERSNCRLLSPGPRHWQLTSQLCRKAQCRGKLVADAQHAAVALEHGCQWVSRDADFTRFQDHGLRFEHLVF